MRAARLDQLRMEEANRAQQMYDQLAGQMRAGGLSYKPLKLGPELPVEDVPADKPVAKKPSAPAKRSSGSKPATPSTAPASATRGPKTTYTPRAVPSATAVPGANAPLSGGAGTTNLGGGSGTDRLEPTVSRPGAKQGIDYLTPQEEAELAKLDGLFKNPAFGSTPQPGLSYAAFRSYGAPADAPQAVQDLRSRMRPRYDELRAKQATASAKARTAGETFVTQLGLENEARARGIQLPTPAAPAPAASAAAPAAASDTQYIYPVPTAGVTPPEARAATAPVQPTVSPAAPTTPQEVVQSETTASQAPVPEAVKKKVNYYTADPTKIPYEMQRALDKREELVRYANIMLASRTGQGVQAFLQIKQQIDAIDTGMIELQGMQGIEELTSNNDPRRLAAVMSQVTGNRLAIQPRSDGTYNIVAAPGTPQQQVIEGAEGISANEVAVHAMRRFSPTYRAQEIADNRETEKLRIKNYFDMQLEGAKASYKLQDTVTGKMYDMNIKQAEIMGKIYAEYVKNQGKISAAMVTAGGKLGLKPAPGATDAEGNPILLFTDNGGNVLRYTPEKVVKTGGGMFSDETVNIFPDQLVPVSGLTLPQGQ
jgi:hypothetical protein